MKRKEMKNGVAERVMPEIGIFSMKINVVLNGILDEKKNFSNRHFN